MTNDDMMEISFTAFWAALDLAMVANGNEPLLWSEARRYWEHAQQAQDGIDADDAMNDTNYVGSPSHY